VDGGAFLKLGVPPTHVTYRTEYVPAPTVLLVLCTVTVLPHPVLPGFKGEVSYGIMMTIHTALDLTY
jgi:hypothetical protein